MATTQKTANDHLHPIHYESSSKVIQILSRRNTIFSLGHSLAVFLDFWSRTMGSGLQVSAAVGENGVLSHSR